MEIRPAEQADAEAITAIYNEAIAERQATFETRPRTPPELAESLAPPDAPRFLVATDAGAVLGWARRTPHSPRACYAGIGDVSVYVAGAARRRGVGRALLDALAEQARADGHWKLMGLLFPTNLASRAACRSAGFREVGTLERHGRLDGAWRDVVLVELLL